MPLEKIEVKDFQGKIEWLWERVKSEGYYWDDTVKGNHMALLQILFDPHSESFYNESGMVSVVGITPKVSGTVHFMLWDRKYPVRSIIEDARELFSYLFDKYELSRLTATIPACNKGAVRIATILGMRFEGALREAFLHEGNYYDIFLYGILRREFSPRKENRDGLSVN